MEYVWDDSNVKMHDTKHSIANFSNKHTITSDVVESHMSISRLLFPLLAKPCGFATLVTVLHSGTEIFHLRKFAACRSPMSKHCIEIHYQETLTTLDHDQESTEMRFKARNERFEAVLTNPRLQAYFDFHRAQCIPGDHSETHLFLQRQSKPHLGLDGRSTTVTIQYLPQKSRKWRTAVPVSRRQEAFSGPSSEEE